MSGVCLASPSYRYKNEASIFLITASAGQREIEVTSPRLELVLQNLIADWHDETFLTSSVDQMRQATALAEIVKFGYSAVPSIIREISKRPSFLFLALEAITGINPIKGPDRGNIEAMCEAWKEWFQSSKFAYV